MKNFFHLFSFLAVVTASTAALTSPKFRTVEIDSKLEIGYGVVLADIDGDGNSDIVLADKKQFAWYRNPTWEKHLLAENLTDRDNVCIDARDIDGDGKAEIAVGAQWNPGETSDEVKSGSVHYLIPPEDRTKLWTPVQLTHEPTVHRMRWVKTPYGDFELLVLPLHGRGNKGGKGAGVRALTYQMPVSVKDTWKTTLLDDNMHMTHNFEIQHNMPENSGQENILIAGVEGVFLFRHRNGSWNRRQIIGSEERANFIGAGEVRSGTLPGGGVFVTTVEPMHGNQLVSYTPPERGGEKHLGIRNVLFEDMSDGHAIACGDLLGVGSDQVVVGWRGNRSNPQFPQLEALVNCQEIMHQNE